MHILSKNIKAQRSSLSGGRMKKAMIIMGYAKIRNAMVQEVLKYKSQKKKLTYCACWQWDGKLEEKKITRGASQNYTNRHSNTGGSTTDSTEPSCGVFKLWDCVHLSISDMHQSISECFYLYMSLYAGACRRDTSAEPEQICFPAGQVKFISSFIIRLLPPPRQISDHGDKQPHGHTVTCFEIADECKIADMQVQNSAFLEAPGQRLTSEPWST